jgi:hypothetical protein
MTFEFSIENQGVTLMKNISPLVLPNFNGLPIEGLDTYIFEFDVLCKNILLHFGCLEDEIIPCYLKEHNPSLVHGSQKRYHPYFGLNEAIISKEISTLLPSPRFIGRDI